MLLHDEKPPFGRKLPKLTYQHIKGFMDRKKRKLRPNLYCFEEDEQYYIKYKGTNGKFNTIAIYWSTGGVSLSDCGFRTNSTKNYLNDLIPAGFLYQDKKVWYWVADWEAEPVKWLGEAYIVGSDVFFRHTHSWDWGMVPNHK